jgi:hypothetical protein
LYVGSTTSARRGDTGWHSTIPPIDPEISKSDLPIDRGPSALPSRTARLLAFAAIVVAGVCGGLIGYAVVNVQCHKACTTPDGLGALGGATLAAGGVAVVAVLVLRAMGEWRRIQADQARQEGDEPYADPR